MPDALEAIKSNMYVDNYLGSSKTLGEVINIATRVKIALATADFHLVGWPSNVLASVEAQKPTGGAPNRAEVEIPPLRNVEATARCSRIQNRGPS